VPTVDLLDDPPTEGVGSPSEESPEPVSTREDMADEGSLGIGNLRDASP
jgi:hypothetical protein